MNKIAFRVDGGKHIGLGHVMRSMVLAKQLNKSNEVLFICRECKEDNLKYEAGIKKIIENGFRVITINEKSTVTEIIKAQQNENIDCLITDSYDVDENYFDTMKDIFKYTGYIDDINISRLNVDFILNQNINAKSMIYNTQPKENTKLFLGPSYVLLREEFRNIEDRDAKEKLENILVTVGGMDKDYNTLKIVNILKHYNIDIHVVVGSAFENELIEELEKVASKKSNIYLYSNANMSELMRKCDMAISASGSTLYELSAMQVPTIGIVVAENQREICNTFSEKKIIVGTGDWIYTDKDKFEHCINEVINDYKKRKALILNQKSVVNINGVELLAEGIHRILTGEK